jgi:hypothetical protein
MPNLAANARTAPPPGFVERIVLTADSLRIEFGFFSPFTVPLSAMSCAFCARVPHARLSSPIFDLVLIHLTHQDLRLFPSF